MRIGILTFHAAHNYGAVLQCYALITFLRKLGHEVSVIDYKSSKLLEVYKWYSCKRWLRKNPFLACKQLCRELKYMPVRRKRYNNFEKFIKQDLPLEPISSISNNPYDIIIIGSDQVWNFNLTKGFDKYYWGAFLHPSKTKLVSYAASMMDSWPVQFDKIIGEFTKNFWKISIRELSIANKIKTITTREITQVDDPTLFINSTEWAKISYPYIGSKPYIFVYQVETTDITIKIANYIAEQKGLDIIYLSARPDDINTENIAASGPEHFLGLIMKAEFVICSSFHGTIFSLIFHKQFYSVKGLGKNARVETLLQRYSLLNRFIDTVPDSIETIDYTKINICASQSSYDYLSSIKS